MDNKGITSKTILAILLCCFILGGCRENKSETKSEVTTREIEIEQKEETTVPNENKDKEKNEVIISNLYQTDKLIEKELDGIVYSIPDSWNKSAIVDKDATDYYDKSMMLVVLIEDSYDESTELMGQTELEVVKEAFSDELKAIEDYEEISSQIESNGKLKLLHYKANISIFGRKENFECIIFIKDYKVYRFMMTVEADCNIDYSNDFNELKLSIRPNSDKKEGMEDISSKDPYFSYSGKGDDVISGFTSKNLSIAHIMNTGNSHFAVKGYYDDKYDLLVNTISPYEGYVLIYPNKEYIFEVSAKGDWKIEISQMDMVSTDKFSGKGDFVTPKFLGTSEVYEIKLRGGGHFAVKGWTDSGYDLLVNTTEENYSGKVLFKNNSEGAFFEIISQGEWEITPVK